MLNILFEKNSSTGLCMSIMLLLLSGFLLYGLYKRYYELRINAHLRTPNKRIHLVSIRTVMRIWGITAILLLCAYAGFFYLAPESDNDAAACDIYDGVRYNGASDDDIREQLEALKKDSSSFSLQKEKPNKHVTVTYAVNNRKEYVYIVEYDLLRKPFKDEMIVVRSSDSSGWSSSEHKLDSQRIVSMQTGKLNSMCDAQKQRIHIYNYTKGENKDRIDYYDSYTIEKGGIHR